VVRANPAAAPTVALTAPNEGETFTNPAAITLTATASAASGATISKVEFFAGPVLIGSSTTPPYSIAWPLPPAGTHQVFAVASDSRYQTATSATRTVTVVRDQLALQLDPGIDGSTTSANSILVSGTLQAPPNSGVTVAGIPAVVTVQGSQFFGNSIPLTPGPNTIELVLTTEDGQQITRTISVNRVGTEPFDLHLDEHDGMAPLYIELRLVNLASEAFDLVEFDFNGDGVVDYSANTIEDAQIGVTLGVGLNRTRVAVKRGGTVIWSTTRAIYVWDSLDMYDLTRGVFDRFKARLMAGQITEAVRLVTQSAREFLAADFQAMTPAELTAAATSLGEPVSADVSHGLVTLTFSRPDGAGEAASSLSLIKDRVGIWRLSAV
jgi:hypothetical protein